LVSVRDPSTCAAQAQPKSLTLLFVRLRTVRSENFGARATDHLATGPELGGGWSLVASLLPSPANSSLTST
jgi:hypothetical protein